jgi:protein-tyrosine-phosphatase
MKQPRAVLFACTQNVIRSPMAAAILHNYYG